MRISFRRNSKGALEITDANDYYPFGMNHLKTGNAFFGESTYKNYKYNGKELQETGMYDYGWRQYMHDVGRWTQLDPLVEDTEDPYAYVFNNPIKLTDPDGRAPDDGEDGECCSKFGKGFKDGFVGTFVGLGEFIADPIGTIKNDPVGFLFGSPVDGVPKATVNTMNGNWYEAGKVSGEITAQVTIAAATEGAGRGVSKVRGKPTSPVIENTTVSEIKPYSKSRPSYGKNQVETVWENAKQKKWKSI